MTVQNNYNNTLYGFTKGDIAVADANGKIQRLQAGPDGSVLAYNSASPLGLLATAEAAPFTNSVSSGGTGATSFTAGQIVFGSGTNPLTTYEFVKTGDNSIDFAVDEANKQFTISHVADQTFPQYVLLSANGTTNLFNPQVVIVDQDAVTNSLSLENDTTCINRTLRIIGDGVHSWKITQNANQQIKVGSMPTTKGTAGYVASTDPTDAIDLVCIDGTNWVAHVVQGNIKVA